MKFLKEKQKNMSKKEKGVAIGIILLLLLLLVGFLIFFSYPTETKKTFKKIVAPVQAQMFGEPDTEEIEVLVDEDGNILDEEDYTAEEIAAIKASGTSKNSSSSKGNSNGNSSSGKGSNSGNSGNNSNSDDNSNTGGGDGNNNGSGSGTCPPSGTRMYEWEKYIKQSMEDQIKSDRMKPKYDKSEEGNISAYRTPAEHPSKIWDELYYTSRGANAYKVVARKKIYYREPTITAVSCTDEGDVYYDVSDTLFHN